MEARLNNIGKKGGKKEETEDSNYCPTKNKLTVYCKNSFEQE